MEKEKMLQIVVQIENDWIQDIKSRYPSISLSQWTAYDIFQKLKEAIKTNEK